MIKTKFIKKGMYLLLISFITIQIGCTSAKTVSFKAPVDTTNKRIKTETKKIFHLSQNDVYASTEFDGARLNGFKYKNDSTALLQVNPENVPINRSPYYAFKTWSETPRSFYFEFQYPKGFKHRYIPKLKMNGEWKIIDSLNLSKKDSIVTMKVDLDKEPLTIAAQEIHNTRDVKNWYTSITNNKADYVTVKSAGETVLGRNLPVIDIYKGDKKNRKLIVLTTRQHPPEVTGYIAFQHFLATILNDSDLSDQFLNEYRILAFPIMNPDGVDLGHWRHNAQGVDLNRDWSVYNQPEIKHVVSFINKTLKKNKSQLVLGLDFHSTWYDVFYTNKTKEATALPTFIESWFSALEKNVENYKVNEQSSNSDRPTSKGWFLYGHNAVGITYEIGDATPKDDIKLIGTVSANEMMRILLEE